MSPESIEKKGLKLVETKGVAEDDEFYHVRSQSNKEKVYIIPKNDFNEHKADCLGFRYNGVCSHTKAIEAFLKAKEKNK